MKRCVLSLEQKIGTEDEFRVSGESEFQSLGPMTENARSPRDIWTYGLERSESDDRVDNVMGCVMDLICRSMIDRKVGLNYSHIGLPGIPYFTGHPVFGGLCLVSRKELSQDTICPVFRLFLVSSFKILDNLF